MVDSDLLRFLKTTQSRYNSNDNNRCVGILNRPDNATETEPTAALATDAARLMDEVTSIFPNASEENLIASPFVSVTSNAVDEASDPVRRGSFVRSDDDVFMQQWLKQYECTNVMSLLKDNGANMEAAYAVGMLIERLSISRAAQMRMRIYFKERKHIWMMKNRSNPESRVMDGSVVSRNFMDEESTIIGKTASECDILPSNADCWNYNNMDQIIEVMFEYGLSAKDICEILISSPSLAFLQPRPLISCSVHGKTTDYHARAGSFGQSLQETLDHVFVGLLMGRNQTHELKLRKYDARKVLRNTPGILTVRGSQSAIQMVQLLINLGVSSNSLSRDKNSLPILLSRKPNAVFRLVAFLSSDAVRMPIHKIGPLLRRSECQDLLNAVSPSRAISQARVFSKQPSSLKPLQKFNNDRIGSSNGKILSVAGVAYQIQKAVVNDIYRRMSETAWTLRNKIGTQDLSRVIAAYPSVLLLDATRQILPTAQYLMDELAILPNDLASVLQLYPALLRTDVEQMRNVVSYLTSLEVAEDNLGIIFRSFPVLLTLDIEHDMEPVVTFLKSIGVSNVGRFVSRLPPILGYSVENELRPKYEYLSSVSNDARFKVTKFPAYFSYPLERVIKSRFEYLRNVKRIPTPLLSLDHILCSGDKDFAVKVARDSDLTQYSRFVELRQKACLSNVSIAEIATIQESVQYPDVASESPEQSSVKRSSSSSTMNQQHESSSPPSSTATAITS